MTEQAATHANRLANETSPYLLQHAHNPVDWWPWGDEAFDIARRQDRPIFLSIGYSTCYWCHVMERESFEDEATAAVLNAHFIPVKVDREERPDIDEVYMAAVQALNQGQGGWPMSVFLEPARLKPFLAGTYFPPRDIHGRPSFRSVLEQIAGFWRERREEVERQAEQVASHVAEQLDVSAEPVGLQQGTVDIATATLIEAADQVHGGFGGAPKFPQPIFLDLLMEAAWDDDRARAIVAHTFDRMAMGGIHDQVGGGFHRYSVDAQWIVPHFEKMLYDNAQLLTTAARLWQRSGDRYHRRVAEGIVRFITGRMVTADGGFCSALDAEVDSREGLTYLWTRDEIADALRAAGSANLVDWTLDVYGVNNGPNFKDPHHPDAAPANVLHLRDHPSALAASSGIELDAWYRRLDEANAILLQTRDRRPQPAMDDKVIAGWNGLMIEALAEAGRIMEQPAWIDLAAGAARFVLEHMVAGDGTLLRTHRWGQARIPAFLEDHAFLAAGLIALYRARWQGDWLTPAAALLENAEKTFGDLSRGGYFDSRAGQTDLFVRTRSIMDGAVPGGQSVMVGNLLNMHELTGEPKWRDRARRTLGSMSRPIHSTPTIAACAVRHLHRLLGDDPHALADGAAAGSGRVEPPSITIEADPPRLDLSDSPRSVRVRITPPNGYFIHAHTPGVGDRTGLLIFVQDGPGVEADPAYPAGDSLRDGLKVHRGTIEVPVTLTATNSAPATRPPRLLVRCQLCTDRHCLPPDTYPVPLEIHPRKTPGNKPPE